MMRIYGAQILPPPQEVALADRDLAAEQVLGREACAQGKLARRALLDFIAHAQEGIRGVVTDPNGTPLAATIEVLGVDRAEDGSMARTDPAVGDYHRVLLPGLYDLRVESPGFLAREIYGIAVTEGEATVADVVLDRKLVRRPSGRMIPDPASASRRISKSVTKTR